MKRILIFILVFALASTANANILLYLNDSPIPESVEILVDEIITVQVYSDDSSSWLSYVIVEDGGVGELSNPEALPNAGDFSYITSYSETGWGSGYEMQADWLAVPTQAGIQFTVDYSSSVTGSAVISLWDDSLAVWPPPEGHVLEVNVVPEPCTVLLLGLGGLAVLKRRR